MKSIKYRHALDGWRWRYLAGNHEILAWAESYVTKQGCLNSIRLLQEASMATVVNANPNRPRLHPLPSGRHIFVWEHKDWRFRYQGQNGEPIVVGEGYTRREGCMHAVSLLQQAYLAPVSEETDAATLRQRRPLPPLSRW